MPRPTLESNDRSRKQPVGTQGTPDAHFVVAPLTRTPGLRERMIAALESCQRQPNSAKRKHGDDEDVLASIQNVLMGVSSDDDGGNDEDDDGDNEDIHDTDNDTSWINRWIDRPVGERRRMNTEDRPGWGKPEIMTAANITEAQYKRYMVSGFFSILAVELTGGISSRNPHMTCAINTST